MLARIAIPVGLFLLWCFVCQRWYVCDIKQVCNDGVKTEVPAEPIAEATPDTRPLVFNWSLASAMTRPNFESYRDSLLKNLPDGHILEIVGHYYKDEPAPEGFPNMGMARANQVKELFASFLPKENEGDEDRILISSRLVEDLADAKTNPFESITFGSIEPTIEEKAEVVEKTPDEATIHFPFNSAQKEADPKVDEFLEKISKRLATSEEKITITGHTDDVGEAAANLKLGKARARQIRNILVAKGVDKSRISIDSKGEAKPLSDNTSEAGRRRNRRAELKIN